MKTWLSAASPTYSLCCNFGALQEKEGTSVLNWINRLKPIPLDCPLSMNMKNEGCVWFRCFVHLKMHLVSFQEDIQLQTHNQQRKILLRSVASEPLYSELHPRTNGIKLWLFLGERIEPWNMLSKFPAQLCIHFASNVASFHHPNKKIMLIISSSKQEDYAERLRLSFIQID